jgi:hypothetical protein
MHVVDDDALDADLDDTGLDTDLDDTETTPTAPI